jgi:hypothetical protein
MLTIRDGFLVFKFGQTKIIFVQNDEYLDSALSSSESQLILSELSFKGGIELDRLIASVPGEYGLHGLSVKVNSSEVFNINSLKFSGGLKLVEMGSGLFASQNSKEVLNELLDDNASGEDNSITIVDCLGDDDFDPSEFTSSFISTIKNTEKQKIIIIASSSNIEYLVEGFKKSGIEAISMPYDDFKVKRSTDVKSLSELTILF